MTAEQLDLFELLGDDAPTAESLAGPETPTRITPANALQAMEAFGRWFMGSAYANVSKPWRKAEPSEALGVPFSGYFLLPPHTEEDQRFCKGTLTDETVAEIEAYYVHGLVGRGGHAPEDLEATRERGYPVSGDQTARRLRCEGTSWRGWPTFSDLQEAQRS